MKAFKDILFPMDFTRYSIDLVEFAVVFARAMRARLHLLHVITREEAPSFDALDEFYHAVHSHDDPEGKRPSPDMPDLLKVNVRDREVWRGITRYASESGVDLVIMSAGSDAPSAPFLPGGTTAMVMFNSACPVMTVRIPAKCRNHESLAELTLPEMEEELATADEAPPAP